MITLILAWVNAKYKADYSILFIGTIVLDFSALLVIETIFKQ